MLLPSRFMMRSIVQRTLYFAARVDGSLDAHLFMKSFMSLDMRIGMEEVMRIFRTVCTSSSGKAAVPHVMHFFSSDFPGLFGGKELDFELTAAQLASASRTIGTFIRSRHPDLLSRKKRRALYPLSIKKRPQTVKPSSSLSAIRSTEKDDRALIVGKSNQEKADIRSI
jgi:hypothetical protein